MANNSIVLDGTSSILFIGNSFTFGRVDPVMSYNTDHVRDMTAPVPGTSFADLTGSNAFEPHPWGGIPGIFYEFASQAGLTYDVAISTRNAGSLQGHYLNSNPANWDLRGNLASQAWDNVVLQDNSTQALPSGAGSITFAAGSNTARLILTPVADTKVEGGTPNSGVPAGQETIGVQIAAGTDYAVGTSSFLTGTIFDGSLPVGDPTLPTVSLVASPAAVLEDGSENLVYSFTRTGPTDQPLTVTFTGARPAGNQPSVATGGDFQQVPTGNGNSIYLFESGGQFTSGSFSFGAGGTIVIPAGQSSATLTLNPAADTTVENDESIVMTLSSNAAYNVGTPGGVTTTILNDDGVASGTTISARLTNGTVYEDEGGNLVWEFTRTGSTTDALTVNLNVNGTATLPGNDFTVAGATTFRTAGAENPNQASFQTYALKLAQYATTGLADGAVPANPNANAATNVFLYETWARARDMVGAFRTETDEVTGEITTYPIAAPEYYTSLEDMTADLRAAYEGLAASNPIFEGVAPVGAAFLSAVQQGIAIRDPFTETIGDDVGNVSLWWDDNFHPSRYGSYLSALTLFGTITGVDPRSMGAGDSAASDLGIDASVAVALQNVAAATLGFSSQAHWTGPGRVTELEGSATGQLASAGAFSFSDSNTANVHTVGAAAATVGAYGTLTANLHTDTTGDGTGGAVNWTYTVDNAAIEFLVAGQTRVEHFTVTVTDQNGGQVQRDIAVTLTGVNDGSEDGPNTLVGNEGADEFFGLGGDDTLIGNGGNDALYGGDGNDHLVGGDGNDHLAGGLDTDRLEGGAGDDVFMLGADIADADSYGPRLIELGDGSLMSLSLAGLAGTRDTAIGGTGYDRIVLDREGSAGYVHDTRAAPTMMSGIEEIVGTDGNDIILTSADYTNDAGVFTVLAGDGDDVVGTGALDDEVSGGAGNDVISGLGGDDRLSGDAGDDRIDGGQGDDRLYGGTGNDTLFGNAGRDVLEGGTGDDSLYGGDGADTLFGDAGNDRIVGGAGDDLAKGGVGDDTFVVTSLADGRDEYDGGSGSDTIDFSALTTAINLRLSDATTTFSSDTLVNIENVTGGSAGDRLIGNALDNVLSGNGGDDTLSGGAGNDRLIGGAGNDTLTGGAGSDQFVFTSLADGTDTITDFRVTGNAQDELHLSLSMFSGFTGDDAFDLVGSGYLRVFATGLGYEIRIDQDGGGDNFQTIAVSTLALTNGTLADHTLLF